MWCAERAKSALNPVVRVLSKVGRWAFGFSTAFGLSGRTALVRLPTGTARNLMGHGVMTSRFQRTWPCCWKGSDLVGPPFAACPFQADFRSWDVLPKPMNDSVLALNPSTPFLRATGACTRTRHEDRAGPPITSH